MAVRLSVIGSSPAWPNPGGACSGYLIDGKLLLDCGPGVLAKLRQREPWPTVEAIAITHLHLDHWGDLIPWVWGSLFGPGESGLRGRSSGCRRAAAPSYGPSSRGSAARTCSSAPSRSPSTSRVRPSRAAGLKVTAVPVKHYDIEAFGFRVEGDRVLAYSGDSGPCPALGELAHDADLLLCEATLASGDLDGPSRGHLAPEEVEAAAAGAHAKRILLTHRPEERPAPAGSELAYDGLELELLETTRRRLVARAGCRTRSTTTSVAGTSNASPIRPAGTRSHAAPRLVEALSGTPWASTRNGEPVRPARPPAATAAARRPRVDEPAPLGPSTIGAKRHVEDHRPHVCSRSREDGDLEADLVGVGVVELPARVVDRIGHDRECRPRASWPSSCRSAGSGRRARMPAPRGRASQRCPRTVPPSRSPGAARPPPSSPGSGARTDPRSRATASRRAVAVFQKRMLTSAPAPTTAPSSETLMSRRRNRGDDSRPGTPR